MGIGGDDPYSCSVWGEVMMGKWTPKRRGRKIFGHGFMEWDPLVKWILLILIVATVLGYVMVGAIVIKVQQKGPWAADPDASPYYNKAISDQSEPGRFVVHHWLGEIFDSDKRANVS